MKNSIINNDDRRGKWAQTERYRNFRGKQNFAIAIEGTMAADI
jgi:hypothetical protein